MNEITAAIKEAIKNKAESSWEETTKHFENGVNPTAFILGYTCGGEDAIGFMMDFFEILRGDFDEFPSGWECLSEQRCEKWGLQFEIIYGTKQLLAKYLMEDNKL